ncbi:MAG TPA: MarR family transcriptional regulator [Bacteroidales bacterium]|nr:MarR family transcriptional regulator [Bacteroidales bacterium]HSA42710.1 MarR family transcriptional regulator [Bacteroidales bacterium]
MDIENLVLDTLKKAGKPMKAGEIAELAGLDKKDVDKAIKKLKTSDRISSPKVCFYEPRS